MGSLIIDRQFIKVVIDKEQSKLTDSVRNVPYFLNE